MEFHKAIFNIAAKKQDLFVSAFKQKVVFGQITESSLYKEETSFVFDCSLYHKIYIGVLPIVKYLSKKSCIKVGTFLRKNNFCYHWLITEEGSMTTVHFCIENRTSDSVPDPQEDILESEQVTFILNLTLNEFNDLVYLICNMCLISLDLSYEYFSIFEKLSNLNETQILNCQNKQNLKKEVKALFNDQMTEMKLHFACELAYCYFDVIVSVHKLKSFFNEEKFSSVTNINEIIDAEISSRN